MRIIAGEFKGRRLAGPPDERTRPMLDRVREALFSTLGAAVDDARVLDLYAGTGSLGLEALSRGARELRAVERDRAVAALLASNVERLGAGGRARVLRGDALDPRHWGEDPQAELVFLDPPYALWREDRGRRKLLATLRLLLADVLAPGGTLVLHCHPRDLHAEDVVGLEARRRDYGNSALWYFERASG